MARNVRKCNRLPEANIQSPTLELRAEKQSIVFCPVEEGLSLPTFVDTRWPLLAGNSHRPYFGTAFAKISPQIIGMRTGIAVRIPSRQHLNEADYFRPRCV